MENPGKKTIIKELLQQQTVATKIASYGMVGVVGFVLFLTWFVFDETQYLPPALISYSVLILLNILFYSIHKNLYVSYIILISLSFLLILYISCVTGGIQSPFAFAFIVLPVGASITSRKEGRRWFAFSILTVLALFFHTFLGIPVVNIIPDDYRDVFAFASMLSILTIVTVMSLLVKYFSYQVHQSYSQASAELKEKTQRLDLLANMLNYSTDLMCIVELPGYNIVDLNPVFRSLLGYEMEELRDKNFFRFMAKEDMVAGTEKRIATLKNGETLDFDCQMICKNGTRKKFNWVGIVKGNKLYASARLMPDSANP